MTYKDSWNTGARTFALHDDRLVISIKTTGFMSREVTVPLADLKPHHDEGRKRSSLLFLGALFVAFAVFWLLSLRGMHNARSLPIGILPLVLGLLLGAIGVRKRRFRIFSFKSGIVAFDILAPRLGSDREFQAFTDEILAKIRKQASPPPEPAVEASPVPDARQRA